MEADFGTTDMAMGQNAGDYTLMDRFFLNPR